MLNIDRKEANEIIDILQDNVSDLSRWSADNDDFLNNEVIEIEELIKRARRQLA